MKLELSGRAGKARAGFTLVEMLVVIAIAALVAAGVVALVFQVFGANAGSSNRMTAVKEVENAVHWLTRDAQMAQVSYVEDMAGDMAGTPFLTLTWTNSYDSPATWNSVTYSVVAGELRRAYSQGSASPGVLQGTAVVARHVDSDSTNTHWSYSFSEHAFTFQVTATVAGLRTASETRSFQVGVRTPTLAP